LLVETYSRNTLHTQHMHISDTHWIQGSSLGVRSHKTVELPHVFKA